MNDVNTLAAIEEGIVAGGGVALVRAKGIGKVATDNLDETTGVQIVNRTIEFR